MRSFRAALAASVAVIPFAFGAAQAADFETPAPVEPVVIYAPTWTGAYVGLTAGYSFANTEFDVGGLFTFDGLGADGLQGGIIGGFNWQVSPRFVVGVEADASISDVTTAITLGGLGNAELTSDWNWAVRGRAGVLITPETLFYLSGGWAWAHSELSGVPLLFDETFSGPQLGVGIESMLTPNVLVRLEYLHTFFNDETLFAGIGGGLSVEPSAGTARLGVVYKFGEDMFGAPVTAAAATPTSSWTGIYAGLNAGYGFANTEISAGPVFGFDGLGSDGFVGGGMVGFDWQLGSRVVLGAEVDAAFADIGSEISIPIAGASIEAKGKWEVAALARAGFLLNPATMIYGLAGWAWTDLELEGTGPGPGFSVSENADGPQIGLGIEAKITDALSARAEYRHTFFDAGNFGTGLPISVEPSVGEARLGVSYKFNWGS